MMFPVLIDVLNQVMCGLNFTYKDADVAHIIKNQILIKFLFFLS